MSDVSKTIFSNGQVYPRYVSDETLKRARTETTDGTALRITGNFNGSATDLTDTNDKIDDVKTAVNTVNTSVGTVNTSVGTVNTTLGTTNSKLTDINDNALTNNTLTGETNARIGAKADSAWNGVSTEASVISILKKIDTSAQTTTDLTTTNGKIDDIKTGITSITSDVGTIETDVDSISTKTGNIETMLGNNLGNIALSASTIELYTDGIQTSTASSSLALGNKADTAWSGSGSGSIIAILKSIYSKL